MFKRKADTEDAKPNKKRLIEITNSNGRKTFKQQFITSEEKETLFKEQFERLRSNDLMSLTPKVNRDASHDYMYNLYCEYQERALADTATEIVKRERDIWRESVNHELQENSAGKCRKALYSVLAGRADGMYESVCDTWEDVMWAYLNESVENMLDEPEKSNDDPIIPRDVVAVASAKDRVMCSDDPRILFHHVQAAILSGTTETLFKEIYLALFRKEENGASKHLKISDDKYFRSHFLRFISTLIIYGIEYLGWEEDKYTVAIVSAYINMNGKDDLFHPIVVAAYTAKQSPLNQIQLYSDFLRNFVGDDDEKSILIQLGKEHGLDMSKTLQYTFTQLYEKAIADASAPISARFTESGTTEEIISEDERLFLAVKWLMYDPLNWVQAGKAINIVLQHFLQCHKIHSIFKLCEVVPFMFAGYLHVESKENEEAAETQKELEKNISLAQSILS